MPSKENIDRQKKLIHWVREAIKKDEALREQYGIKDKFRFVREKLQGLLQRLENDLAHMQADESSAEALSFSSEDSLIVYIHLYNAHGVSLKSWQSLLNPRLLYEYSVNRPVYGEKGHIEAFLRSKASKQHHAYLTISISKSDLVLGRESKDVAGHPLLKIKEGSLHFNRVMGFTHNDIEYEVNEQGEVKKKLD